MSFLRFYCSGLLLISGLVLGFNPTTDNLSLCKNSLYDYIDSGAYLDDLNKQNAIALKSVQVTFSSIDNKQKAAVVFDIDETILSNVPAMRKYGFGGDQAIFDAIVAKADAEVIESTKKIYDWAKDHNIAVYFITGRPDDLSRPTIENLNLVGINSWDGLYFWPRGSKDTVKQFKLAMRKKIHDGGYDVILNLGDQHSDLLGGYAENNIKLPNPFYLIPSNHRR